MKRILLIETLGKSESPLVFDASTKELLDTACKTLLKELVDQDALDVGQEPPHFDSTIPPGLPEWIHMAAMKHRPQAYYDRIQWEARVKLLEDVNSVLKGAASDCDIPLSFDVLKRATCDMWWLSLIDTSLS